MAFLMPALGGVAEQIQMQEDLRYSIVFAVGAVLCSGVLALALPVPWLCVLSVPGLFGGLALGLFLLALFQTSWLASLYDTPLVLLLASTLLLLPPAPPRPWVGTSPSITNRFCPA